MMESLDVESRAANGRCRLIPLRKYSLAICLLEAVAICLFIYLLLQSGRTDQDQINQHYQQSKISKSNGSADYRVYSSGPQSARLLAGVVGRCSLRQHDLRHSVQCHSSAWPECAPVEWQDRQLQLDVSSATGAGERQVAVVVSTTKSGRRLHKRQVPLQQIDCKPQLEPHLDPCRFSTRIVVQLQQRQQQIIGWGGALTDSSAQNILALSTNGTRRLLDDYFGSEGLRFNMVRITIGGSDFSARFYTNDDSLKDDLELERFKLREEDLLYKIPLLRFIATQYGGQWAEGAGLKVFASMWSPPTWMKTNNHFNKGQMKGSISGEQSATVPREELYFDALAELKLRFILAYQQETGLRIWGLTVMNEPVFAVQPFLSFNTMIFPRQDYANYVAKYLGPKLRRRPELRQLKLIAHDDNRRYLASYTAPTLAHWQARRFIDGVATHGYADESYEQMDLLLQSYGASANGSFFVLPTELCSGHLPFMEKALVGNWHRGLHYALDIIRGLQHSAAGWVDWNMALDTEGGPGWLGGRLDAPVIVDKQRDMYHKSPMFYVLGQFSRYIPPGSVKLQTKVYNDLFDNHFEVVTFALPDDQKLATVVLNNNPYPIELKVKISREQKNAGSQANTYYIYTCEADSVSTIIYSNKL